MLRVITLVRLACLKFRISMVWSWYDHMFGLILPNSVDSFLISS